MKKIHLPILAAFLLLAGCQKEVVNAPSNPSMALLSSIPQYSEPELKALATDTGNEAALKGKVELIAYAMTRFLGEHGNLNNNTDLAATLPCDIGLDDPDGILRVLGNSSGMNDEAVLGQLNGYIFDCAQGCSNIPGGSNGYFEAISENLSYLGTDYDLFTLHDPATTYTVQSNFFLGHGLIFDGNEYRVEGFLYDLVDDQINSAQLTISEALDLNAVFLELWEEGLDRHNDPCYYIYNYSGGSSGGGGGSSGGGSGNSNDDDGANKNYINGPLSFPPFGYEENMCPGKTGLRVTEFHLARRNEGGWFGGKSEVYFNVSFYNSGNPFLYMQTNNRSQEIDAMTISGNKYNLDRGKLLAEVPQSDISSSQNTVITETSGFTYDGDWILIDSGFCEGATPTTYNRVYVSAFERDPKPFPGINYGYTYYDSVMLADGSVDDWQPLYMPHNSDCWVDITLQVSDFANQDHLYLVDVGAGPTTISFTQPAANTSWFLIELFTP